MALKCPVCDVDMKPRMVGDIEVDLCEKNCKGIWFDEGELQKIVEKKENNSLDRVKEFFHPQDGSHTEETKRKCPRCDVMLNRHYWNDNNEVYLDICHQCKGYWLDLKKINLIKEQRKKLASESGRESLCGFFEELYDPEGIFIDITVNQFVDFLCYLGEKQKV